MTTKTSKSDHNLKKLKAALAAGGLAATIIGAGLLGSQADATAVNATADNTALTEPAGTTNIDANVPPQLNLNLEAIPTAAAPTFSGRSVAVGRSSG
ncbi:MAG: hypothetical protein KC421_09755 [Anaerolineales bacterium]|nr:hypothetical protein [Anaerolineales bacterium]